MQTIINDIELALQDGILGFHNIIEVTEVFSISPNKKLSNILTLMVAENINKPIITGESFLTNKPISINHFKNWSFGIKRYYIEIDELILKLGRLNNDGVWDKNQIHINNLKRVDKYFVSPDSYESVPINNILKNNFHNGSYVFEWFDFDKENHQELLSSPQGLQKLSDKIYEALPLYISSVSDRIGNFLLQIPSSILMANFGLEKENETHFLNCNIAWHEHACKRDLIINCHLSENDNICEGYYTKILKNGESKTSLPIANKRSHIGTIWDPENNFILARTRPSAFISPDARITTTVSTLNERVLTYNGLSKVVSVLKPDNNIANPHNAKPIINWTKKRIYENNSTKLRQSRNFVQYNAKGINKKQSKIKALEDLVYLINQYGEHAVWLWDPYLSFQDLFDTLLMNKYSKSVMRAIGSLELPPDSNETPSRDIHESKALHTIRKYKESFNALPLETIKTLNLEFRCKTGNNGWDFHDRFIIFPSTDYQSNTLAWSLGTSINSFGTSHHILQKVQDAQLVADAFLDLWDSLSGSDCLVWRHSNV
ncbi:VPA1262 family N-terminal domain-containing protein [Erwinia sp. MMLR14_017]|uniref:VPA1262 family N-terminal domain-containing protein n=1 Tax=Erwinia sp. MMLR14_017 TaxID=3093842 RepID=UPI0029900A73|nr:VPA1262 family N-terminal domain-containing protein [Erwinia sp. MMLR14_017]MDW8847027.1 VPA1262 family N-terminal domain-containing protein [Erwinia sp. MMLR14_017]